MYPLLLLALWALSAAPAAPRTAAPAAVTVPMSLLRTRHAVVSVRLNDRGPFRLILDTGSPLTVVSGRAAAAAGLVTEAEARRPTLMGMRGSHRVRRVSVGGVTVTDLDVVVLDHPVIQALDRVDGPVDGIVGYTFFGRFRTTLDYERGEASFRPVAFRPEDVLQTMLARVMTGDTRKVIAPAALWGFTVREGEDGVVVVRVYAGSPAGCPLGGAGLRPGDRLLLVDGRWVESALDCHAAAAVLPPGETVLVRVRRGGGELELKLRPVPGF